MKDANSIHTINMNQANTSIALASVASNRELLPSEDQILKFWQRVKKSDECWEWQGYRDKSGYGRTQIGNWRVNPHLVMAHRLSFAINIQQPGSFLVLHKCDNRCCVNPDHLFLGDQQENIRDMDMKQRRASADGERAGSAKMTNEKVLEARKLYADGGLTITGLAIKYGLSKHCMGKVLRRKSWKHV